MIKYKNHMVVAALLMSAVAFAARDGFIALVNDLKAQVFQGGIYIGSAAKNPQGDTRNKIAYSLVGVKVYDFPALGGVGGPLDNICAEAASTLTITGCGFNDVLSVGVDQTLVNPFGSVTAYVKSANTIGLVACAPGITDAGSFNMPDASYTVRCTGD